MLYGWYTLDGLNDYFFRDNDGTFNVDDHDFMIECWIKSNSAPSNYGLVVKRGGTGDYGFEFHTLAADSLSFFLRSNNGALPIFNQNLGLSDLFDGEWHHVVITFDRDGNAVGYKDGIAGSTPRDISSHDDSINSTADLFVGQRYNDAQRFPGDISSLRIYDFGINGLPDNIESLIKAQADNAGYIHDQLKSYLIDGWDWHENPSLIGLNQNLLIAQGSPQYWGGKLAAEIIALLTYQFRNSENFQKLIAALCSELQDLKNEINNVYKLRSINLAFGEQLDGIGEIVGESRNGRDDDDYRESLYFRILVNASKGLPENVIDACLILMKGSWVTYLENPPAKIELITDGQYIPSNLFEILRAVAPIGVDIETIISTFEASPMFYWQTEYGAQKGVGFSEMNSDTGQLYYEGGKLAEVIPNGV